MNKGNTESHAETRSSRRQSNPPTSALSAAPREKKIRLGNQDIQKRQETGTGNVFQFWMHQFPLPRTQ